MIKTVIVGLGNPILADDGVGIKVAEELRTLIGHRDDVDVNQAYAGGLRIMDVVMGYDKAIIIDAMLNQNGVPGEIRKFGLEDFAATKNLFSTHDMDLNSAFELAKITGYKVPNEVIIWGIEALDILTFSEELTEVVAASVPTVVQNILADLSDSHENELSVVGLKNIEYQRG